MDGIAATVRELDRSATIESVVSRLQDYERTADGFYNPDGSGPAARAERRPPPNGVACFNGLYLRVTEEVRDSLPGFEAPAFVERLDVVFADFFFQAYEAAGENAWIPKSWAPLFELKDHPRVIPLQFALAGMNAHINNDLAYALVQTWHEFEVEPGDDTPEYRDFLRVNEILKAVEEEVKVPLSDAFIRALDVAFGRADDWLALWKVAKARADAWERAEKLRAHPDGDFESFHDRLVGFASHLLLLPQLAHR